MGAPRHYFFASGLTREDLRRPTGPVFFRAADGSWLVVAENGETTEVADEATAADLANASPSCTAHSSAVSK